MCRLLSDLGMRNMGRRIMPPTPLRLSTDTSAVGAIRSASGTDEMARDPDAASPGQYTPSVGSNTVEHDTVASRQLLKLALDDEIKSCRRCDTG